MEYILLKRQTMIKEIKPYIQDKRNIFTYSIKTFNFKTYHFVKKEPIQK